MRRYSYAGQERQKKKVKKLHPKDEALIYP